jgi:hypothetical protein
MEDARLSGVLIELKYIRTNNRAYSASYAILNINFKLQSKPLSFPKLRF